MSTEKIIEQIRKDSQKEINQIHREVEEQTASIIERFKKEAVLESEKIISRAENQGENIKKILVSKVSQDTKRDIMITKEKIIDKCFIKAQDNLSSLQGAEYKKIVNKLIEAGLKKLDGQCTVIVSRDIDRKLAKEKGLTVTGHKEATGGIILKSVDDKITLDYTFEGILKRKKDEIRIKIGKMLFSK